MAWRPYEQLISGELSNTKPGEVTGHLHFYGLTEPVVLVLKGDFHRDIRGAKIRLSGSGAAPDLEKSRQYMEGFATSQFGTVGDITAGLEPCDYVDYPYIEWYSDANGRIVLELAPEQVTVVGKILPWRREQPLSRQEMDQHLRNFLVGTMRRLGGDVQ